MRTFLRLGLAAARLSALTKVSTLWRVSSVSRCGLMARSAFDVEIRARDYTMVLELT